MRSYIKLYGPPVYDAIKALEKLAVDVPEVCIMDQIIVSTDPDLSDTRLTMQDSSQGVGIFSDFFGRNISVERCGNIISKSGEKLGRHDFFFEWFKDPSMDELNGLIQKIDKTLKPLGCRYTIETVR